LPPLEKCFWPPLEKINLLPPLERIFLKPMLPALLPLQFDTILLLSSTSDRFVWVGVATAPTCNTRNSEELTQLEILAVAAPT